jgi:uncharacterized protein (TIGR00290 family)
LSWSSGKDGAWALHRLKQDPAVEVAGLLTTVNLEFDRVNMHAVRTRLLEKQAGETGIKPWVVGLPHPCSDQRYGEIMGGVVRKAKDEGVTAVAFGDLYLQDVREYRERQLHGSGIEPLFPLWMEDTADLAREMQSAGLKAVVTCVDPRRLDRSFSGREWDARFLDDLPEGVDSCGENGEYHTFAYGGPVFSGEINVRRGETVDRDGFVFTDLLVD